MADSTAEQNVHTVQRLNPVLFGLMDDGRPNVQGIEDLSIWDIEPVARAVVDTVRELLGSAGLDDSALAPT